MTTKDDNAFATSGLTKREYFAAIIMQGLVTSRKTDGYEEYIAERAIKCTDALINQLNKPQ